MCSTCFKSGDEYLLINYRTSVLPCCSKILDRIKKKFSENKTSYEKQFDFQSAYSTEHAILQIFNRISNSSNKKKSRLVAFMPLTRWTIKYGLKNWKNME